MEFRDPYFCRDLARVHPNFGGRGSFYTSSLIQQGELHGNNPQGGRSSEPKVFDSSNDCFEVVEKSTYTTWLRFFCEGRASLLDSVVEAFLAYWLSWYMLANRSEDSLNPYIFPLKILGLLIWARWMDREYHPGSGSIWLGHSRMFCFIQVFIWERFPSINLKPTKFHKVVIEVAVIRTGQRR